MMLIIIHLDLLRHILTAARNISLVQLLWPLWSLLGRLGQGSGLPKVTGGVLVSLSPRHQNSTCQLNNHGKAHITSACTFQTSFLSNPADLVWDRTSKSMRLWRIREHSVWMYGEHSGIGKHNGRRDSMLWDCSDSSGLLKKKEEIWQWRFQQYEGYGNHSIPRDHIETCQNELLFSVLDVLHHQSPMQWHKPRGGIYKTKQRFKLTGSFEV